MDISVLILFFNRPDHLQRVFAEVRRAQPSRLFLYQDGPRGEQDLAGIEACREVVANVDWPCEVHRNYQEQNSGCDPSNYLAQQWAFSIADKCIVLEDDDVPTLSFFRFCKEMLDRYETDSRVGMIHGFNVVGEVADADADYVFTNNFSVWGWASWRRVVQQWDATYSWLDDPQAVRRIEQIVSERGLRRDFLPMCRAHRASGKPFYETIFYAHLLLNSQLSIAPRLNLVSNNGVQDDSTHFAGSVRLLPRGYRRIFTMPRNELQFPLRHPNSVCEDVAYRHQVYRIMAWNHPWVKLYRSVEELLLNLRYGQWRNIRRALTNRLSIILRGRKHH